MKHLLAAAAAWLLVLAPQTTLAQRSGASTDLFYLQETTSVPTFKETSYKTLDPQAINTGIQNCIWITAGQSNIVNVAPSNFLPVNPNALSNLNPNDGALYKAEDPLVGTNVPSATPAVPMGFYTATIAATTMTVSAVSSGGLGVGQTISGSGVTKAVITALGSGSGGTGTYTISVSQTVAAPTAITSTWNGGHPPLRTADAMVTTGKCARVIIEPIAVNGTSIADWNGGVYGLRLSVAIRRIAQRISPNKCGDANISCAVLWGQGETDNINGTSQATYTAGLNSLIATGNAVATSLGWSATWGRWLVARQTFYNGFGTNAGLQAAQAAVVNGTQVFAGANADALQGNVCGPAANVACRTPDPSHFSDNGSYSYAVGPTNGWQAALHASGAPY